MTALIVILVIIVILILFIIGIYNKMIRLGVRCDEGFSTMDIYLTKRHDLIPNLVETVKGYTKHESTTLENVIKARNMAMNSSNIEEKLQSENAISGTLKTLFAVAEAYPDLKADTQFINLQEQLSGIESEIAQSRKYYNAVVKEFNTALAVFPNNIIAGMFHFNSRPMYEIEDKENRKNVEVHF